MAEASHQEARFLIPRLASVGRAVRVVCTCQVFLVFRGDPDPTGAHGEGHVNCCAQWSPKAHVDPDLTTVASTSRDDIVVGRVAHADCLGVRQARAVRVNIIYHK